MDDFNSKNNLDYERDPLDIKNLNGVQWNEALRKVEPPPLFLDSKHDQSVKHDNSLNSLTFIAYFFIVFFVLMGLTWVYRLFYSYFFG